MGGLFVWPKGKTEIHLTIDGIGDRHLLNDPLRVETFLKVMPREIEMTPIAPVAIRERPEGGVIGIVIIAESHISIHTEPDGRFWADVFSCKDFDISRAKSVTAGAFGLRPEDLRWSVLDRGNLPPVSNRRESMVL